LTPLPARDFADYSRTSGTLLYYSPQQIADLVHRAEWMGLTGTVAELNDLMVWELDLLTRRPRIWH
jgi:hypothetical protein